MGGRGTSSGLTPADAMPTAPAAPEPEQQPQQNTRAAARLVSETGIQDMDDTALTDLISRAMSAPAPTDGRQDTPAQRIADALGISAQVPESVTQEAFAQYRGQSGETGLLYRTVKDTAQKTARQIAHELTSHTESYGWNYGGGRAYGTGLYFVGTGPRSRPGESASHSAGYGSGPGRSYTVEAMLKPGARIATDSDLDGTAARRWARAHQRSLRSLGLLVDASGFVSRAGRSSMSYDDVKTTMALLMGYDGYHESDSSNTYHTIFNLGALRVARGNKYDRARTGSLK